MSGSGITPIRSCYNWSSGAGPVCCSTALFLTRILAALMNTKSKNVRFLGVRIANESRNVLENAITTQRGIANDSEPLQWEDHWTCWRISSSLSSVNLPPEIAGSFFTSISSRKAITNRRSFLFLGGLFGRKRFALRRNIHIRCF